MNDKGLVLFLYHFSSVRWMQKHILIYWRNHLRLHVYKKYPFEISAYLHHMLHLGAWGVFFTSWTRCHFVKDFLYSTAVAHFTSGCSEKNYVKSLSKGPSNGLSYTGIYAINLWLLSICFYFYHKAANTTCDHKIHPSFLTIPQTQRSQLGSCRG